MKLLRGLSFSISQVIGLAGIKNKVAKRIGVPTTRGGLECKIGGFF